MFVNVVLADHAVSKLYYTIGHIFDGIIMCYHDDRVAVFLVYGLDQFQDFFGSVVIQRSGRLCIISTDNKTPGRS